MSRLYAAYECTRKTLDAFAKIKKPYYDHGAESVRIQVGDRVYLQNAHCGVCLARKFCQKCNGPYRIIERVQNVDFKIKDIKEGTIITAHPNRLKVARGGG